MSNIRNKRKAVFGIDYDSDQHKLLLQSVYVTETKQVFNALTDFKSPDIYQIAAKRNDTIIYLHPEANPAKPALKLIKKLKKLELCEAELEINCPGILFDFYMVAENKKLPKSWSIIERKSDICNDLERKKILPILSIK